jgi:hypothetical protein
MASPQFLCAVRRVTFRGFRRVLGTIVNIWGRRLSLRLFLLFLRKRGVQAGDTCLLGKRGCPLTSFSSVSRIHTDAEKVIKIYQRGMQNQPLVAGNEPTCDFQPVSPLHSFQHRFGGFPRQ